MTRETRSGYVLGVGLVALLDGIVFHQLLRWHHLVSARTSDLDAHLLADGAFQLVAVALVGLGVVQLRQSRSRNGRAFVGALLVGAGLFNAAEIVVDHYLLRLHVLHPNGDMRYDLGLLVASVLVAAGGAWLLHRARDGARTVRRTGHTG